MVRARSQKHLLDAVASLFPIREKGQNTDTFQPYGDDALSNILPTATDLKHHRDSERMNRNNSKPTGLLPSSRC